MTIWNSFSPLLCWLSADYKQTLQGEEEEKVEEVEEEEELQMQTIGESIVSYEPGWQTSVAELRVLTAFDDDDTFWGFIWKWYGSSIQWNIN